jgi:hypothetical protein
MRPPNFLLITADQQRADCLGMEGRRIRTPHLDQLAQEGTCFTAGITSNVVCQPSRVSILTGELYDLEHDPDEMDNVFDQPSTKTVRRKLEALIQSRPDDMRPVQSPVGMV